MGSLMPSTEKTCDVFILLLTVMAVDPELVIVIGRPALDPTVRFPKLRLLGLKLSCARAGSAASRTVAKNNRWKYLGSRGSLLM